MLPQDTRSPFEQQRSFEIINDDQANAIPPYACCEVVTTEILEKDRVIIHVKRPTKDGMPNVILNGMMPLAAAVNLTDVVTSSSGYGLRDYPAFALCADGNVGDMYGSQKDSFALKKNAPGFVILGPGEDNAGTKRVMYFWQALLFKATLSGTLCSSDVTALISDVKFLQTCKAIDITTAKNTMGLAGPNVSPVYGLWDCDVNDWALFQIKHREQQVVNDVYSGDCAIIEQFIKKTALMYCTDPDTKTAVQLYPTPFARNLRLNNTIMGGSGMETGVCQVEADMQTICVFNDLSMVSANWVSKVPFTAVPVLNNVTQSGLNIIGTRIDVFVPCYTDPYDAVLITLEDCPPPGSGSGS